MCCSRINCIFSLKILSLIHSTHISISLSFSTCLSLAHSLASSNIESLSQSLKCFSFSLNLSPSLNFSPTIPSVMSHSPLSVLNSTISWFSSSLITTSLAKLLGVIVCFGFSTSFLKSVFPRLMSSSLFSFHSIWSH